MANTKIWSLYSSIISAIYVKLRLLILPLNDIEVEVPQSGNILDVGCGYGFSTIYFALNSTSRKLKGVELNPDRVKQAVLAAKSISNVSFAVDNLADNQKNTYDAIVLIDLLHHLNDSQKHTLISKCWNLLKDGGLVIVKDINTTPRLKYIWNYLHDKIMTRGQSLSFLSSVQTISLFKEYNFNTVKHNPISGYFYPHYLYVFQK